MLTGKEGPKWYAADLSSAQRGTRGKASTAGVEVSVDQACIPHNQLPGGGQGSNITISALRAPRVEVSS